MFFSNLAIHSLFNNRRQYISLFMVCLIGVSLILSAVSITDGMFSTVRYKARQYYGGDIQFLGGWDIGKTNADEEIEILREVLPHDVQIFKRLDHDAASFHFFFEGNSVRQRVLKGVNFDDEKDLFKLFKFSSGGAYSNDTHNSVIISKSLASRLGVQVGDEILLEGNTIYGSTNTITLVLSGIFQDTSLFGMYTSYLDIRALQQILLFPDNYVNRINFYYGDKQPTVQQIKALQAKLSEKFNMYPLTNNKQNFYDALNSPKDQPLYAIITLDANIVDLEVLIDAIKAVIILVTVILILIISIGIGSTYKVIVMKRITEIGTYRAIGMKPSGVTLLFVTETLFLLTVGFISGIIMTFIITFVLSRFDFSFIPAFDMFLMKGCLVPNYNVPKALGLMSIITVTTLISVLFTIRKAVHISPVGALATTN